MLLSMILTPVSAVLAAPAQSAGAAPVLQAPTSSDGLTAELPSLATAQTGQAKPTVIGETDAGGTAIARYIVLLAADPLALYKGGADGFAATNPSAAGTDRLAMKTSAAEAYLGYLDMQQTEALNAISATIGRSPSIVFDYKVTLNGFTLELSPREAAKVARQDGVKVVYRDYMQQLETDAGPAWIGAPGIWDGSATMDGVGTKGEGVVVGILDTGINMGNPSFAATGGDGYTHTNPRGKYYGVCDPASDVYDPAFTCNDKLIGAWDFSDGDEETDGPEDNDGHGSHTASTTAGNVIDPAVMVAPTYTYTATISGVAPHANIIAYDVCVPVGCSSAAIAAAIEQATTDQVDVINYSIGGGAFDPWGDADALAYLAAAEAGVTVATSAGNAGPAPGTVGSPADAPWIMSVGASTHNRKMANSLTNMTGGDTAPPADIDGKSITGGYGPAKIVYAGDYGDALCQDPFDAGTFSGEIVVCDRGIVARVAKGANVLAGGAGGYILANDEANDASLNADPHALPAVHITYADGQVLKDWLASGADHMGTIAGTTINIDDANGDIMAAFSSRGPNVSALDIIKPDITGPGVDIFAAFKTPEQFWFESGTSMSSPHLAGSAALVKAVHPDWTPMEIKSAIMLTSKTENVFKEDGVTPSDPFDRGAGRVDLGKAALAGFVLNESADDFLAADPFFGGDPTALNLASLGDGNCIDACSWTRVLTSTQDADVSWTVSITAPAGILVTVDPMNFTLAAGGMQTVTITADVSGADLDTWNFGQIDFTPDSEATVSAHMPLAVYASVGQVPDTTIETRRNQGAYTIENVVTTAIDDLDATLYSAAPEISQEEIAPDPTNDDPYDLDSGGVIYTLRTIKDTTKLFGVTTSDSTAPDLDLFVGLDTNGNGKPDPDEELCSSTTGTANELCQLTAPMDAGEYWILVQNWDGSDADLDVFTLSISIIDESDTGPMTVTGPASTEGGVPFDLTVAWNVPDMSAGDTLFGLLELGDKANQAINIASSVTLKRLDDDVIFSADKDTAGAGDAITYTIDVLPETSIMGDAVNYSFVVTLPDGVTYTDGSATIEPTSVAGNTITWENVDISTLRDYVMTDSSTDASCGTPFGGYIDLEGFGLTAVDVISGTTFVGDVDAFFGSDAPYNFYGEYYPSLYFTADGFGTVISDVGATPGDNMDMPDAALPNGVIAPFWRDLAVVYDADANRGVTIAGAGGGALMVIEYDDVEPAPAGSTEDRFDFEIVMLRDVDDSDGAKEIVLAYDNLNGSLTPATIGVENANGTAAQKYAYNDAELEDGFMICYDWTVPTTTLTFEVTVNSEAALSAAAMTTTTLENTVNVAGFGTDTDTVEIDIEAPTAIDDEDPTFIPSEGSRIFLPVINSQ
jgi:subtilisin family serine protease